MMKRYKIITVWMVVCLFFVGSASADNYGDVPLPMDSRIKTLVYNENEIFKIAVHYGYQCSIEFAKDEAISTYSLGSDYAWFIKAAGPRRLFIKALEGSAHTNMTLITNKRIYQFELESKDPNDALDEELVYVVRFFYPSENLDKPRVKVDTKHFAPVLLQQKKSYNFDYSLTGPETIAPIKVFDDGKSTFLQFPDDNAVIPHIFTVASDGSENRASYSRKGDFIVIGQVGEKLVLRLGKDTVHVYNELNSNNGQ